jgi:hypothetical protein
MNEEPVRDVRGEIPPNVMEACQTLFNFLPPGGLLKVEMYTQSNLVVPGIGKNQELVGELHIVSPVSTLKMDLIGEKVE